MKIRFQQDADVELAEARQWYAHQRTDLDLEFMDCIEEALSRVARYPDLFPVVFRDLRRVVVRRFPFAIFYRVTQDEIQVVAVFHSRRNPRIWKTRL